MAQSKLDVEQAELRFVVQTLRLSRMKILEPLKNIQAKKDVTGNKLGHRENVVDQIDLNVLANLLNLVLDRLFGLQNFGKFKFALLHSAK